MTLLEATFRYGATPGERELAALNDMRNVYGIFRLSFDERRRLITVEYDASRLGADDIAFMLRNAGIDLQEQMPWAA